MTPPKNIPTIRGMFVNSHIKAVRDALGERGERELEHRYGKPLVFKTFEYIPVRDEVRIIELALDLLYPAERTQTERAEHAGRLHFRNFTRTSYGMIILSALPRDFKKMMMNAKYIAEHVFMGIAFTPVDLGPHVLKVIMKNGDYPIEHFKGLFEEWMLHFDLEGAVTAHETEPHVFSYMLTWHP